MTTTTASPHPLVRRAGERMRRIGVHDFGILGVVIALFLVLSVSSDAFLTKTNLLNIADQYAPLGIIACGATLVIIAGGFDLSAGAVFALSGVVATKLAQTIDPYLAILAGIAAGLLLGVFNSLLITFGRVNTFIATLASSLVFRGIALLLTGGVLVTVRDPGFAELGRNQVLGIKFTIWLLLIVIVATGVLLWRTRLGRYIYAAGGNAEAARLSGVNVDLVRSITFAISGLCAGLAGVMSASRVSTGQADAGVGLELTAIAATVIGGTSILGGEGAVWRTVLGIMLLAMIGNGFNLLDINPTYQQIVQGALIVGAVSLDAWARGRS
jgi:ribose transport system permease protein